MERIANPLEQSFVGSNPTPASFSGVRRRGVRFDGTGQPAPADQQRAAKLSRASMRMRCWLAVMVTIRAMSILRDVAGLVRRVPLLATASAPGGVQRACQGRRPGTGAEKTATRRSGAGLRAPRAFRLCGLLYHNLTARCAPATLVAGTILVMGPALAGPVAAQPAAPVVQGITAPDPAQGLRVFQDLQSWLVEGEPPARGPRVAGAMVWARSGDGVLARASAVTLDPAGLDLADVVREPISQAITRVLPGGVRDATWREQWASAAKELRLSLELSGPLIPYAPRTFREVDLEIAPGLEGLAVRSGDVLAAVFPSAQRWGVMAPSAVLSAAIAQATGTPGLAIPGDPRAEPGALAAQLGLAFYRFRTVHVAQTGPGEPGTFLYRGGVVIPEAAVKQASMREALDATLLHLAWRAESPERVPAVYDPVAARLEGECDVRQSALAAYALERGASTTTDPRVRERARHAARTLIDTRDEAPDVAARALRLLVLVSSSADPGLAMALADGLERESDLGLAGSLVASALAQAQRGAAARRVLDAVYKDTPPAELASHLPWIVWAERTLAGDAGGEVAAAPALRQLREALQASMMTHADAGDDGRDMVGGIVFSAGNAALPSWHTARAVGGLAAMLVVPSLTDPDDRLTQVARLVPMLRFLRQLDASGGATWLYADPEQARGGVRGVVWDQRQPIEACAMVALALAESLDALDGIARERAGPGVRP